MSHPTAPSSLRTNLEIVAIGLGALMASLSQTLIIPVLPVIEADIGASVTQSSWLLTSTLLVGAVAVPIISRLADMFGRRLMLLVALMSLATGSLIDALTTDPSVMIFGRALCGLAGASIPLGISLLHTQLPPERRGSATALISAMLGIGGALGLPLAGLLADNVDYHVLYWIGAVGAALSAALVVAVVAESKPSNPGRIDWTGMVLLAAGLVSLVLPLSQASSWGWGSVRTVGLLVLAVVLLVLLVVVERRITNPLVDMRTLSRPPIVITNVASLFFGFALFASFVGTSNYVQMPEETGYGFGSSVLTAGLCLLPSGVLMLLLAPLAARLIGSWGPGRVLGTAGIILTAGLLLRIVLVGELWQVVLGTAIIGAGTGIGYASLPALINSHTPPDELAAANGINTLARSLGSTLASALGGTLLASLTASVAALGGAELPSLTAFRVLFGICAAASALAAVAGFALASPKVGTESREPQPA